VAPGQAGRLWKFSNSLGPRLLLTVPPYLARDGRELLLPTEVVRADSKRPSKLKTTTDGKRHESKIRQAPIQLETATGKRDGIVDLP